MIFALVMIFCGRGVKGSDNALALMFLVFLAACFELYYEHPHLMRLLDSLVK